MSVVISNSVEWFSCLEKIGVNQPGEGGVSVPVIAERKDVSHILVLKETDPGIVPAIPPILFTRFAIISSPDMKGTGLGLSICKSIMEDRGGRIWAEKNAEEEATFYYGTDILLQVYLYAEFRSTCCDRKHYANAEKRELSILLTMKNRLMTLGISIALILSLVSSGILASVKAASSAATSATSPTSTAIKNLVIIFQENVSFDHYFGTYPNAANPPREPKFTTDSHTPSVNELTPALLNNNPNGNYSMNPFRLDRSQAITCDMNHEYTAEQQAYHGGLLDKFIEFTGPTDPGCTDMAHKKLVMGYYDGNTVTALWNYAQHFAMNDNFFGTTFGPSTPASFNLISGNTVGGLPRNQFNDDGTPTGIINGTVVGDADPKVDDCSGKGVRMQMTGKNVGDLLNAKGITWGWFQGGFKPTSRTADGKAACDASHKNINGTIVVDYNPHHEAFMYYNSTANPHHLPATSVAMTGKTDQANHQYDLSDFWAAAQSGNMPAVSFIKAPKYQNGHPGYSDPLDEQNFLASTINRLQSLPEWNSTAVIIAYDDSDGWYDHVMPPIVSQSNDHKNDRLLGSQGLCGHAPAGLAQDRCGYGPRVPMLVISPYAKTNFVDHSLTDQTSILRFIEDNWGLGRMDNQSFDAKAGSITNMFDFSSSTGHHSEKLFLSPTTGMQNSTGLKK